jgi:radical SAM family uncharacterized protein
MKYREISKYILSVKSPAQYLGGEYGVVRKNKQEIDVRFAFCFPDTYEIGMSHLGLRILYGLINSRPEYWCERIFAPAPDFEKLLREMDVTLSALESYDPMNTFDFVGFTLQYELSYTNVLNMLDLGGVPIRASERGENDPIVIAGGPCCCNPEPMADFFDFFVLGDGEEVTLEILDLYNSIKKGRSEHVRSDFLERVADIEGVYIPKKFVEIDRKSGNNLSQKHKIFPKKRVITDLDNMYFPETMIVPVTSIVHDRAVEEVLRGCIRGCRFCQAGFIYRPYREKQIGTIASQVKSLCDFSGYDTVSLSSLSTSDYIEIEKLLSEVNKYTDSNNIGLSLPSMRIDRFSENILNELMKVKKSGLTFAPEAGSQRLRDVINKNITEEEILGGCKIAFMSGISSVKLYFMIGLPTETDEDITAIAGLADKIIDTFYEYYPKEVNGKNAKRVPPRIGISASTFIPKPFTPFQFTGQATEEEIHHKQRLIRDLTRSKRNVDVSYGDYRVSFLEAVLARGNRKLCNVIYSAWKKGCKLDGWDEHFHWKKWQEAFVENCIDPNLYAQQEPTKDDVLPWDHLDYMISKDFLYEEWQKALTGARTPSCREQCSNCGIISHLGECTACH